MAERNTAVPAQPELLPLLPADVAGLLTLAEERAVRGPYARPDGSAFFVVPSDMRTVEVPALNLALPDHVTQTETMIEPASFIDYLIAFKSPTAICRASLGQCSVVAVLDYHGRAREVGDAAVPGRGRHVVTLGCPHDLDYAKWRKVLGEFLPQDKMIAFIEDMIHTVAEPAAADLLEAFADIEIDRAVKFKSKRNDKNGNVTFTYEEVDGETKRAVQFTLPDHIMIVVAIFQGGPSIALTAKVRVRMDKGELAIGLAVAGLDKIEREAFRSIGEEVRERTGAPVYYVA